MELTKQQIQVMNLISEDGLINPIPTKTAELAAKIASAGSLISSYISAAEAETAYYNAYYNLDDDNDTNDLSEPSPSEHPGAVPDEIAEILSVVSAVPEQIATVATVIATLETHVDAHISNLKYEHGAVMAGIDVYAGMGLSTGKDYQECYGSIDGSTIDDLIASLSDAMDTLISEIYYKTWSNEDYYGGVERNFVYETDIVQAGVIQATANVLASYVATLNAVPTREEAKKALMIEYVEKFSEANRAILMVDNKNSIATIKAISSSDLKAALGI